MVFPGSRVSPSPTSYLESDSPYHPHNMADVAKLNKTLLLPQKGGGVSTGDNMHNMEFGHFWHFLMLYTVKKIGNSSEIVCQVAYDKGFPHIYILYMTIYSCISSYIRKDFASDPFRISLYINFPLFYHSSSCSRWCSLLCVSLSDELWPFFWKVDMVFHYQKCFTNVGLVANGGWRGGGGRKVFFQKKP
jgi:hypothetical protein